MKFTLRPATNQDRAEIERLVFGVLAEYGLASDPGGTDADLQDIEGEYFRKGGSFDVLVAENGALLAGAVVGIGYPFVDIALKCRMPESEACVWGKAYFPLTMAVSVVLLGGIAAGLVYGFLIWRRRRG